MEKLETLISSVLNITDMLSNISDDLVENLKGTCPECGNPTLGSRCDTCGG